MSEPASPGAVPRTGTLATSLAVLFGVTGLGSAAVAVALPVVAAELDVSAGRAALVVSGYSLALTVGSAVFGRLGDIFGIRAPLAVGVAVMVTAGCLGALVDTLPALVATRLLQGLGAAAVPALTLAAVQASFTGSERTRALATYAGTSATINALGPVLGSALADTHGWRPVVALPLVTLAVLPFVWRRLPAHRHPGTSLDVPGALLVGTSVAGAVLALQAATLGPTTALAGLATLTVTAPLLARHARRHPRGIVPAALVTHRTARRSLVTAISLPAAWFGMLVALPLSLAAHGRPVTTIGLLLLPAAVLGLLAPRLTGPALTRLGPTRGQLVAALGTALALAVAAAGAATAEPALVVLASCLLMLSFGLGQPAMTTLVADSVPAGSRGSALGLLTLCFLMGGSVGAAAVGGLGEILGPPRALATLCVLPLLAAASFARPSTRTSPPSPTAPHPQEKP